MTGYVKVLSTISVNKIDQENNITNDIDWYARGGVHRNSAPCEGTSLNGIIYVNGTVEWIKEIWQTGGFTNAKAIAKVTDSIIGRWIGWKVIMYNINNETAVKMESYLDNNDTNKWVKVAHIIDNGEWYARTR
jgi:hypothetical protein